MNIQLWSGRTLQRVTSKGTQFFRASVTTQELTLESWTAGKAPKITRKPFDSEQKALLELHKAVRKKLLEDYVVLNRDAAPGSICFACALPGGGPADNFDLSPDSQTLFVGAGRGDPSANVLKASLITGAVQRVAVAPNPPFDQLFIHGIIGHPTGDSGWFGLNQVVRSVDFRTHVQTEIASVTGADGIGFVNSHTVELQRDANHTRMILIHGAELHAYDLASGALLRAIPLALKRFECGSIALSPSGEFALLDCVDPDSSNTTQLSHTILVFRLRDGALVHRVAVSFDRVRHMTLSPDDSTLVMSSDNQESVVCIQLATGAQRTFVPFPSESFGVRSGLHWTPEGHLGLLHANALHLFDLQTLTEVRSEPLEPWSVYAQRSLLTRDGTHFVVGGEGTFLVFKRPKSLPPT